jgi:hypothetical protein
MAPRARAASLLFPPGTPLEEPEARGSPLAEHLDARTLARGDTVEAPGGTAGVVEAVDPDPGEVGSDTELTVVVPELAPEGALSLAVLVDASLTMGKGDPSAYEEAADIVDAVLLNGRAFLQSVGLVVQGGETRDVQGPMVPEDATGASILRERPRGRFDLRAGLEATADLLDGAPRGRRAVLLVTDDADAVDDPVGLAGYLARERVALHALAPEEAQALSSACAWTGGAAATDAERVFEALAEHAGSAATWAPPPERDLDEDATFEVVIDAVEGSR